MSDDQREQVIGKVGDTVDVLIDVLSAGIVGVDGGYRPEIERLLKVLAYGVGVLSVADADLIPRCVLDQVEFYATAAETEISGGDPSKTAQYTDSVLTHLAQVPVSGYEQSLDMLSETVTRIQRKAYGRLDALEQQISALEEQADKRAAQEAADAIKTQLDEVRDQTRESIGGIQESIRSAEASVNDLTARLEEFEAKRGSEFSEAQTQRDGE